ncbi:NB-ARC domain-containing protein [Scytonema sp. UIC 10036]|uniref:NB-ARC domain-containing protein n=1 Tax=Scytonema sp. UIC 10036 TaxID=2304196 RepID=UPI0012DA2186|nr:NB-ARC domain-containing protein [Scytonema sp. UIC 10036]
MTEITAKPERTFGLIVGIERYQNSTWNVKGGGPVNDALKFAEWLCYKRGVPQENIRLCLSPVEENQELVRQCQLPVAGATLPNLDDIINNFLLRQSGDLLFIFWAGHGLITSERDRRLLCADATYQNWQNIDLNTLLQLLNSDWFEIRNHICLLDACANCYLDLPKRPTHLGGKIFNSGKPRQDSQQFILLATRDGEKAKVSPQKTGYFSQAVREALEQAPAEIFPPNMKDVAEQVKQRLEGLEKKQLPTYWYYRSWNGDKEEQHFNPFDIPHNIPPSNAKIFVGREKQLEQLHQLLHEKGIGAITDVTGEGGVGKTELAIRYSLENLENYDGGCCWLNVVKATEIGTQLTEFGRIHFPNFNPSGLSLDGQIQYCWKNWRSGKVLLVFDNVTDWEEIKDYLPPHGSQFKVLITTRQQTLPCSSLALGELSPDAALELLKELLGEERVKQDPESAKILCKHVGYIPFGIYQIAAIARKPRGVLC